MNWKASSAFRGVLNDERRTLSTTQLVGISEKDRNQMMADLMFLQRELRGFWLKAPLQGQHLRKSLSLTRLVGLYLNDGTLTHEEYREWRRLFDARMTLAFDDLDWQVGQIENAYARKMSFEEFQGAQDGDKSQSAH
jgi:hypothetical protein